MFFGWRQKLLGCIDCIRIIRGQRCQQRSDCNNNQDNQTNQCNLVFFKATADIIPQSSVVTCTCWLFFFYNVFKCVIWKNIACVYLDCFIFHVLHPFLFNSWICKCIQNVCQEVAQNQNRSRQHCISHNHWIITGLNCGHSQCSKSWPTKDRFDNKRTNYQRCKTHSYQCDDREQTVF